MRRAGRRDGNRSDERSGRRRESTRPVAVWWRDLTRSRASAVQRRGGGGLRFERSAWPRIARGSRARHHTASLTIEARRQRCPSAGGRRSAAEPPRGRGLATNGRGHKGDGRRGWLRPAIFGGEEIKRRARTHRKVFVQESWESCEQRRAGQESAIGRWGRGYQASLARRSRSRRRMAATKPTGSRCESDNAASGERARAARARLGEPAGHAGAAWGAGRGREREKGGREVSVRR